MQVAHSFNSVKVNIDCDCGKRFNHSFTYEEVRRSQCSVRCPNCLSVYRYDEIKEKVIKI